MAPDNAKSTGQEANTDQIRSLVDRLEDLKTQVDKHEAKLDEFELIREQNEEMREILLAVANTVPEDSELYSRIMEVV